MKSKKKDFSPFRFTDENQCLFTIGDSNKPARVNTHKNPIGKTRLSPNSKRSTQCGPSGRIYLTLPRLGIDRSTRCPILHDILVQLRDI